MTSSPFALALLTAVVLTGCITEPRVDTPAADPAARSASGPPMPRSLGVDETTRQTNEMLAAVGADKMEGLKPMKMEGMDHSKMGSMPGMDHSKMPGMDHSKMPGMHQAGATPAPADKKALTEEMKKLSGEMKDTSGELKKKAEGQTKEAPATPAPSHEQHGAPGKASTPAPPR